MKRIKIYNFDQIKSNNNLIFNIRNDIIFKNCFLDPIGKLYLIKLINILFKENYNEMNIKNNELLVKAF